MPCFSPAKSRGTMCGCCSFAASWISSRNRSVFTSAATSGEKTLIATTRPRERSCATKTRLIPPPCSSRSKVYVSPRVPRRVWIRSASGALLSWYGAACSLRKDCAPEALAEWRPQYLRRERRDSGQRARRETDSRTDLAIRVTLPHVEGRSQIFSQMGEWKHAEIPDSPRHSWCGQTDTRGAKGYIREVGRCDSRAEPPGS